MPASARPRPPAAARSASRAQAPATAVSACAAPSTHAASGIGKTLPTRASGVTSRLTSGIATAFASGLTSEIWENSKTVSGTSPSVIAYCVCAAETSAARQPDSGATPSARCGARPTVVYRMRPTAPNDSQKPGHSTAHGSSTSTTASARHSTCETLVMRPAQSAAATTDSMYSVLCAGTPKPASSTYSKAMPAPANAAAFCAGRRSGNCAPVKNECRHSQNTRLANRPAIIVICNPEIDIKCEIPVRLNTFQSDWLTARWSPTTSATITPAYSLSGKAAKIRARSQPRQASTTLPKLQTKASSRRFCGASARSGRT